MIQSQLKSLKAKKKLYRAAIVGCGRIASTFDQDPLRRKYVASHAGAYFKNKNTELVAACDIDPKRLKDFGEFWKVDHLYNDLDVMLERERPDILSVCTWAETHYEMVRKAVAAGVKLIFCEKPIAKALKEADELVAYCKKKGAVLLVNHSRRFDTGHHQLKVLHDEKLGRPMQASCYYTAGLLNTATHLFDLLRLFWGDAKWVQASPDIVIGDREKDPTLSGTIGFQNGALATIAGLDVKDYLIFEADFYGSNGRLRVADSGFKAFYWNTGDHSHYSGYKELKSPKTLNYKHKEMLLNAVSNMVECLNGKAEPLCSGEDGIKALEIIYAFHESFRTGKRVDLPIKNRSLKLGI